MDRASTFAFALEPFAVFWPDAQPLLDAHFSEIGSFQDIPLNPDKDFYERAESAGNFRIYTVRVIEETDEPQLIGYAAFFVNPNPHYAASVQAVADVVYLYPEWRKGGLGQQLLKFAELELVAEGVEVIYHHVKADHLTLAILLDANDYELMDLVFAKRIARTTPIRRLADMLVRIHDWIRRKVR